tara:strand:+ start:207 stop:464 length:258 start_codon:yes stop_codon:yes gene_type:complete
MKAIGKYILVKTIEEEVTTDSGLLLSHEEASKLRYKKAKVINIGGDVEYIEEGNEIYYDQSGSHTMLIDNETYTIILQHHVVVVL